MKSWQIRRKFLDFFKSKGHQIVPSSPIVVKNDPTLLFTNAGMNQFKDYFLGNRNPDYKRVVDTQKCLRVSGKHNDLEEVGLDTYHHTMFEMLGNWSFGDYFKKEAIEWAWELLTKEYGLNEDSLYVSVFGGDKEENLEPDQEAYDLWNQIIPKEKIIFGSKKDNFWEMGDVGPCGPCSEIHIDLRTETEKKHTPGKELVNTGNPLVIEIWNLVFIQFNRKSDGKLINLPQKHVDTGMGFERLAMAIQGKVSNYDTDIFTPIISEITKLAGIKYGENDSSDVAFRVISDHIRAICFTIADGQLPSNVGAGYVIRRILRRAVRYGNTFLGLKEPFLYKLVKVIVNEMGDFFSELKDQKEFLEKVIMEEETSFLRTLENGLKRLASIKSTTKGKLINGKLAFELYDTFGFPLDLTNLIAREDGYLVDETEFKAEMDKQKDRSKADAKKVTGDWVELISDEPSGFVGHDNLTSEIKILKYRTVKEKEKNKVQAVFDQTPFYAESGGQIGDTGRIQSENETITILDTQKENNLIVHLLEKLPENPSSIFKAQVDGIRRKSIMNNHSATHLLHAALREVLGDHVQQKGSLVADNILRFDFSHFSKMTDEELNKVEEIVNEKIQANIQRDVKENMPIGEAKRMGAIALFGEKYGDIVRVVTFDPDYSIELCGGTHVPFTGQIGFFKITSEGSVAAGVRRIEAVTGKGAINFVKGQVELINKLKEILKDPKDVVRSVRTLIEESSQLAREVGALQRREQRDVKESLKKKLNTSGGINILIERIEVPSPEILKNIAFELRSEVKDIFLVLCSVITDKPQIVVAISDSLVKSKSLNAASIVKELAKEIKGGGGGQPFIATAGGKDASGLNRVLTMGRKLAENI